MYNKKLFEKICNVTCSFEELETFVIKIDEKEFDLNNPFKKYYDLKIILYAIQRYEKKEIDDKYLAYWMNAYNWIIMGGFKIEPKDNSFTFEEWLEWEICDWLDSLSFFDVSRECYNLEDYKNSLAVLDKIYRNANDWDRVFAHTDEYNEDDVVVLAYNKKSKEFVKIYGELEASCLDCLDVKFQKIELDELEKQVEILRKTGYQKLKYGTWDEEED